MRKELSDAERAVAMARRQVLYNAKHGIVPRAFKGNQHTSGKLQTATNQQPSFASQVATVTGRSEDSTYRDMRRHKALGPEKLKRIQGKSLDSGVEIDATGKLPEDEQEALISRAERGEVVSVMRGSTVPASIAATFIDNVEPLARTHV